MLEGAELWLHKFHLEPALDSKASLLLAHCPDPDTGTVAVEQLLANESPLRAAAFAFAAFPAAVAGHLPIGAEGINDLGRAAQPLLTVDGEVSWQERISTSGTTHPELTRFAVVLGQLSGARRARAQQLFYHAALNKLPVADAAAFEAEFDRTVTVFATGATR